MTAWSVFLSFFVLCVFFQSISGAKEIEVEFDNNVHLEETETGGQLSLESKGKLSDIVDLDRTASVKIYELCYRPVHSYQLVTWVYSISNGGTENQDSPGGVLVLCFPITDNRISGNQLRALCKGSTILVALKKDEPEVNWKPGQIIMGSDVWNCALNTLKPGAISIYAKIEKIMRPKQYVVEVHTIPAGPLDMFEDATIKVHYEQGKLTPSRQRRYLSNPLKKALNTINWNASFSSNIPFNNDGNEKAEQEINLFKETGPHVPEVNTDKNMSYAGKDFLFTCHNCHGYSHMSYYFELKIYKVENKAVIKNYKMEMEMVSHLHHNYSLYTDKEVTLTKSGMLWKIPSTNIFQTPLAIFRTLPPIKIAVNFSSQANIFLKSTTKNETDYRGDFTLGGRTVISQSYENGAPMKNEISSYNWTVSSNRQTVDTNATMIASYAIHQNITVVPLIFWEMKDVDMTLGPPIKISIKPSVNVVSTTDTLSRCDKSQLFVDSNVSIAKTDFKVDAFGISIWDVKLMDKVGRKMKLLHKPLMERCHADCHGPSDLNSYVSVDAACHPPSAAIVRGDERFKRLHQLWGDYILFASEETSTSWCGTPTRSCPNCTYSSNSDDINDACAERIVNPDLAASLTRLAKLIHVEWPDRKLLVKEAWDEPTSNFPYRRHGNLSIFNEGRGAEVTVTKSLTDHTHYTVETDPFVLQRLGELSVCARFKRVKREGTKLALCVEKVANTNVKRRSLLSRNRRSGNMEHSMVSELLTQIDIELKAVMGNMTDPAPLSVGESYPPGKTFDNLCGDYTGHISQDDVPRFKRLVEFPLDSVTFAAEGPTDSWCGVETRVCRSCKTTSLDFYDTWSWCGTRTMNMRLALRLQRLATLTGGRVEVLKALSMNMSDGSPKLYMEGRFVWKTERVARLRPSISMSTKQFTSKAILAGFDYIHFSAPDYIEVCVKSQDGIQAQVVQFPLANLIAVPLPLGEENEFDYPTLMAHEPRKPLLFDKSMSSDIISEHFKLNHFQSPGKRFLRLDPILIDLLELAYDNFFGGFHVIPGSGYRSRSVNNDNIDTRHNNEKHRFQMGQAVEIKPNTVVTEDKLFGLAVALIRAARTVRWQRLAVGFGCKMDRLYFEIRPMLEEDSEAIEVWSSGNDNLYQRLQEIETLVAQGGTVVSASSDAVICATPKLGEDHFYFNFDLDEEGHCWTDHDDFCSKTHEHRYNVSIVLQRRLTSAAGTGKLPRSDIMPEITDCVINTCGGCPNSGSVWNQKVIVCTKMILKYLSRASVPFQPLQNKVSFFNTDNHDSAVHSQACHYNKVCVENTNIYSLLLPLTTAKFQEDNVDELLFGGADNPSPLLEIVEQELAWRAEGSVNVFIENTKDINTMRNTIKILMFYNKKVTNLVLHLNPDADEEEVEVTLQRKIEEWSGSVCPHWSRIVSTPFTVYTIPRDRKRRSLERSKDRNKMTLEMKNWEIDWMLKS